MDNQNAVSNPRTPYKFILSYRITFCIIAAWSIITNRYVRCFIDNKCLDGYKFFSTQTHYMILAWYILSILWRKNSGKLNLLTGRLQGAIAVYATITSVIYTILLFKVETGIDFWTNIITHYVSPWGFVLHFVLTENKRYKWKYSVLWLIYPILYSGFALMYSAFFPEPIYFFVNINDLNVFALWFPILLIMFLMVGLLYIFINNLIVKEI